jgi:hypothetical protein
MRKLLLVILILFSIQCFSAEVNCYSRKTRIYHGFGHNFGFNDDFMAFIENKTGHLILVSGQCVIMVPIEQGEKLNAVNLREKGADTQGLW